MRTAGSPSFPPARETALRFDRPCNPHPTTATFNTSGVRRVAAKAPGHAAAASVPAEAARNERRAAGIGADSARGRADAPP